MTGGKSRAALALAVFAVAVAHAAGDPTRGAKVFGQCAACHSVKTAEHMTGPSLAHAYGHRAASAEGFSRYSEALKRSGLSWDEATLDKWLASPAKLVPGTAMTFPGLQNRQARQDVIAYLKAVDEGKAAPTAARGGGMMMGMGGSKPDLRNPPPAGQVRSITYCADTYTVETADGKVEKVWEFNLRFKTDSSRLGPAPGKPVVIGAGMQGDRASVVFANPKEIGDTIKASCP